MVRMWMECLSSSDMLRRGETGHLEVEEEGGGEEAEVVEGEKEVLEEVLEEAGEEEAGEGVSAQQFNFCNLPLLENHLFLTAHANVSALISLSQEAHLQGRPGLPEPFRNSKAPK